KVRGAKLQDEEDKTGQKRLSLAFESATDRDVYTAVLGHELGHAINEDHSLALKGDAQCKVNPNLDRCYGLTPEEIRNIMGVGTEITEINVGPWIDHLQHI